MRLIRTAAYILLGYAIFEFVAGMFEDAHAASEDEATPVDMNRTSWEREGRGNVHGGAGRSVDTLGAEGAASHVRVGRGVIRS